MIGSDYGFRCLLLSGSAGPERGEINQPTFTLILATHTPPPHTRRDLDYINDIENTLLVDSTTVGTTGVRCIFLL